MKKNLFLYVSIFVIYAVFDILYNIFIGMGLSETLKEGANITDIFRVSLSGKHVLSIFAFFVFISYSNLILVVNPAIKAKSKKKAFLYGALLGFTAYMTLELPLYWMIIDFPFMLVILDTIVGTVLSAIASGLTVLFFLRPSFKE